MDFGERLKNARKDSGLKQSELAEMIDVKSAGVISNWENNINKPDLNKIIRLCEVLGVSVSYLLDFYSNTVNVSSDDQEFIKKYHILDERGKDVVNYILNSEYKRCKEALICQENI